jgi:hypothetical protein
MLLEVIMAMALDAVSLASTQRMEDDGVKKEETGAARKLADSASDVVVAALSVAICVYNEMQEASHGMNDDWFAKSTRT